jgi:hypothetical protein
VVIVNGGPQLGLPAVEFSVAPYWDAHYQGRPWYGRKAYWQARWQNRAPAPPWQPPAGMPAR